MMISENSSMGKIAKGREKGILALKEGEGGQNLGNLQTH